MEGVTHHHGVCYCLQLLFTVIVYMLSSYNGDHIVDIMTVVGNKLVIYLSQQHKYASY